MVGDADAKPSSAHESDEMPSPSNFSDKIAHFLGSALHMAALTGNLGAVEMLLAHGAKPGSQMHPRQQTPLHLAAMCGHASCIDVLLRHAPAGVNLAKIEDAMGRTPAFRAAKRGHAEVAAALERLEAE